MTKANLPAVQQSKEPTNSERQSRLATNSLRVLKFDLTISDEDCDEIIAYLDGSEAAAGLQAAEAAMRAIIDSHPKSDVANPPGYLAACASIMSEYPAGVLRRVSDPRTGIVRRIKWLPKPSEITEACDAEMKRRSDLLKRAAAIKRMRPARFDLMTSSSAHH